MKYSVENKIVLNGAEYTYVVHRKKIKNIYFRVKEDLKIHVSIPYLFTNKEIIKLLIKNSEQIEELYNKMNIDSDKLLYLGEELEYIYSNDIKIDGKFIYAPDKDIASDYIYNKAFDLFNSRLTQLKHNFNDLPEFTLRARKMTSRWGVCNSGSMSVTLNTKLITKPIHLIDYVIIHELCHFKHMNHSKEYWKYVESIYPYYKKARKELKY